MSDDSQPMPTTDNQIAKRPEAQQLDERAWISARLAAHRSHLRDKTSAANLRNKAMQLRAQADALEAAAKAAPPPPKLAQLLVPRTLPDPRQSVRKIDNLAKCLATVLDAPEHLSAPSQDQQPCDLEEMIRALCQELSAQANARSVELLLDYTPNLPQNFVVDPTALKALIRCGLLEGINACKDGYVLVRVSGHMLNQNRCRILLSFEDNGLGIAPKDLLRLFGPYQPTPQLASPTGAPKRLIVEREGLMVWCESTPRNGTIFGLRIDLGCPLPSQRGTALPNRSFIGCRALVIAPRFQARAIYERDMITLGLPLTMCRNIVEALCKIRSDVSPDIIFLDDAHNADEAAQRLRRAGYRNPIVLLSHTPSKANQHAYDAILAKPLRRRDLYATLSQLTQQPKSQKSVVLPLHRQDVQEERSPLASPPRVDLSPRLLAPKTLDKQPRNMRLLVIEPNQTNQLMIRKMLTDLPIDLRILRDERGVLREVETKYPDLIMLDVALARHEQIIAHIRASEIRLRRAHTPLIALTHASIDLPVGGMEAQNMASFATPKHCSSSLEKPLRKSALLKAILDHRPSFCHAFDIPTPQPH